MGQMGMAYQPEEKLPEGCGCMGQVPVWRRVDSIECCLASGVAIVSEFIEKGREAICPTFKEPDSLSVLEVCAALGPHHVGRSRRDLPGHRDCNKTPLRRVYRGRISVSAHSMRSTSSRITRIAC